MLSRVLLLVALVPLALCEVYFKEEFLDDSWRDRWVDSTHKGAEQGKWELSAGKFYNDPTKDKGIKTTQDAKFYDTGAKFAKPFDNAGKTLVIQFQVKHEQNIDCGGGYVKLLGSDVDQKDFHGDTPYKVMFGPDICGPGTKKVHVIFNYKGKNLLIKKEIRCKDDELSHLYTLIVRPDNTYEVLIDNERAEGGELEADWDFLAPKKIKDPSAKKPEDWDERAKIDDPSDTKPADFDKPKTIPDPKAKKPDDWDDEMDGEWEPPMVDNPDYKGDWKPKQIDNPAYKGIWVHPEIDNPDYVPDSDLYKQSDIGAIGFDLWQVKSGSIFDNIFVGDDPAEAKAHGEATWKVASEGEKKMKEKQDEADREKAEAEEAKRKAEEAANKKPEEATPPTPASEGDSKSDPKDEL